MFEALFILTTIDSGTRDRPLPAAGVRRPRLWKPLGAHRLAARHAGARRSSSCCRGRYFIWTGSISYDLADVRRREPAAGGRSRWPSATTLIINIGPRSATRGSRSCRSCFVDGDDADRRGPERPRQLLADGDRTRSARSTSRATSTRSAPAIMLLCAVIILVETVAPIAQRADRHACRCCRWPSPRRSDPANAPA